MKLCSTCRTQKALDDFHRDRTRRDGHTRRCKACTSEYQRARYLMNPEPTKARVRMWEEENRERLNARRRRWAAKNRAAVRDYHAAWVASNLERAREIGRMSENRRRAKRAQVVSDLTDEQWQTILDAAAGRCAYCGKRCNLTMDHVVPISLGGGHTASNVVAACSSCNTSKGAGPVRPYQLWLAPG